MAFTDIRQEGWITRLPAAWQPYAILMRLDRPIGWWLLLIPCWWGVVLSSGGLAGMTTHTWGFMGLFFIGAIIMRGAGCIINDLWDRDLDALVARTRERPLASGVISQKSALTFLSVLLLIGAGILFLLPTLSVWIGLFSLVLIITYPLMKRITWWPQAFLGITFNIGALIASAAVTGTIGWSATFLYIAGIFWTLGYDTIYAHQDRDDDTLIGIKSTARLFGDKSRWWVGAFYVLAAMFLFFAAYAAQGKLPALTCLLLSFSHLAWQVWHWRMNDPANCLAVFKSNRDFGGLVLLSFFVVSL